MSLNERGTDNLGSEEKVQEEEKSSEGLILKELPKHLKYAFFREERSKPVIIAANLTAKKSRRLWRFLESIRRLFLGQYKI